MTRVVQIAACILVGVAGFVAGQSALPQSGLRGHYFNNLTRSGEPVVSTIDPVVSTETLARGMGRSWPAYSVEWTGAIVLGRAGSYTFATVSDDGSEMDVADVTVVRNGGSHGPQEATGRVDLPAGVHPVRIRYEQGGGGFHLELKYGFGDAPLSSIPPEVLLPDVMSLMAYRVRSASPLLLGAIAVLLFLALQRFAPAVRERPVAMLQVLSRPRVAIGVLISVAVVARIIMTLGSDGILWADSDVFLDTANAIKYGRWFEHDPYRTLTYPYFLWAFFSISSERPMDQIIVGVQQLLGLITVISLFAVLRSAFSIRVALAGALLFAVHTTQLFYESSILTEALFNCLLALSLLVVLWYIKQPSLPRAMAVMAACVVLTMTRPVAQGFIAVPLLLTLFVSVNWRKRLLLAGAMAVTYVLALQPWMMVNQRMYGFHGVALGQGLGLFIRTSQIERYEPQMYGGYPEIQELLTFARTTQSATGHVVDGLRRRGYSSAMIDDLLYRASVSAIAQRPFEFAAHSVRQWWRLLGSLDDEDICPSAEGPYICSDRTIGYVREPFLNRPREGDRPIRSVVVWYFQNLRIPMHVVTTLAAFGVIAGLMTPSRVLLLRLFLAGTIVYFTLLPAITQSLQDRFRLPVDGLLFAFAAFGVAAFVRTLLRRATVE